MAKQNAINNRGNYFKPAYDYSNYATLIQEITLTRSADIKIESTNTNTVTMTADVGATHATFIKVENDFNDSVAASTFLVKVANSASNAYFEASTDAVTWTFGSAPIDASNTKFVLSPSATFNTGNVMEAKESGEVNFPLQPSFNAFVNANVNNVTGNSTIYTILFNSEVYDIGSDYATATGTFTAPIAGKYHFCSTADIGGIGSAASDPIIYAMVTSNRSYYGSYQKGSTSKNFYSEIGLKIETLADMDAADTCYIIVRSFGEVSDINDVIGSATSNKTYFCGKLVC